MSKQPSEILNFKYYSEEEDKHFNGTFKLRRISVFGANEIQMTGNRLTNGLGMTNTIHAEMVRYMSVVGHMIVDVMADGEWYDKDDLIKTWSNIHDMNLLHALHKEVVSYDEWFRLRHISKSDQKENQEEGEVEHSGVVNSTDGVGRKKSKHKSTEQGVSEVIVG